VSFTADHDAIRGFGRAVDDLGADAATAKGYAERHLSIGYGEGRMFFTVVETANDVKAALADNYRLLQALATGSAGQLGRAADYYRDTDEDSAARVDASYEPGRGMPS
jgi:hypothetical protein